jgi:hypothetical protein
MAEKESEWPRIKREPVGFYQHPDGILKSTRSLAGPLRLGTSRGVGPGGLTGEGNSSDFGLDRVTPRKMDPIGTSATRAPQVREPSSLLSRESRSKRDGE